MEGLSAGKEFAHCSADPDRDAESTRNVNHGLAALHKHAVAHSLLLVDAEVDLSAGAHAQSVSDLIVGLTADRVGGGEGLDNDVDDPVAVEDRAEAVHFAELVLLEHQRHSQLGGLPDFGELLFDNLIFLLENVMLLVNHLIAHLVCEGQLVHVLHHLHLCQVRQLLAMKRSLEAAEGWDDCFDDAGNVLTEHIGSNLGHDRQGRHLPSQVRQLIVSQGQASPLDLEPAQFGLFDGGYFLQLLVEARLLRCEH